MEVLRNGKFSLTLSGKSLARGLKKNENIVRDKHAMVAMTGLISKDDVLQAMKQLSRIDTDVIGDAFPYPQLFVLSNHIIICSATKIYDYTSGALVLKLTVSANNTWKLVDFIEYIYMSNGDTNVIRTASTGEFTVTTDLPTASAMCNYNGQVLIGSPGV